MRKISNGIYEIINAWKFWTLNGTKQLLIRQGGIELNCELNWIELNWTLTWGTLNFDLPTLNFELWPVFGVCTLNFDLGPSRLKNQKITPPEHLLFQFRWLIVRHRLRLAALCDTHTVSCPFFMWRMPVNFAKCLSKVCEKSAVNFEFFLGLVGTKRKSFWPRLVAAYCPCFGFLCGRMRFQGLPCRVGCARSRVRPKGEVRTPLNRTTAWAVYQTVWRWSSPTKVTCLKAKWCWKGRRRRQIFLSMTTLNWTLTCYRPHIELNWTLTLGTLNWFELCSIPNEISSWDF